MADTKISALTAIASLAAEDLFPVVDDPAGTPITKKATGAQVRALVVSDTAFANSWDGVTDQSPSKNAVYDKLEAHLNPARISANWYWLDYLTAQITSGSAFAANRIYYVPFMLFARTTLTDLGCAVTTTQAANNLALALYANNGATGRPTGTPLANTGDISTAVAGFVSGDITGVASVTLEPGVYWAAFWASAASGVAALATAAVGQAGKLIGSATGSTVINNTPAPFGSVTSDEAYNASAWPNASSETIVENTNGGARAYQIVGKAA